MAELKAVRQPHPIDDDYVPQPSWLGEDPEAARRVAERRRGIRVVEGGADALANHH